jgi:glycosyltransferase involved in cell wall biosynthesis
MRIAQIAPLHERVPPRLYGGTERVVSFLTEELVRQGHDVTLFASGDSQTSAKLVRCCEMALRLNPVVQDTLPYHMIMLDEVRRRVDEFDILHFHIDVLHAPLVRDIADRTLTTLHGRLDLLDLAPFYAAFRDLPLTSISNNQQEYLSNVNWQSTIYHGLPHDLLPFCPNASGYLAFLGRIAPEKRPERAIEIAARCDMPLKIAAKVDRADQTYWEDKVRPMVEAKADVEFLGEIGESDKAGFLGGAAALLFPIDWPEPFGLVMIEAMACDTPVIAYRQGAIPEIIQENVSGFVFDTIEEEAVAAVRQVANLDRAKVRAEFERRFTAERMARDYVGIYRRLLSARTQPAQVAILNGRHEQWRAPQLSRRGSNGVEVHNELQVAGTISAHISHRSDVELLAGSSRSSVLHPLARRPDRHSGSRMTIGACCIPRAALPPGRTRNVHV